MSCEAVEGDVDNDGQSEHSDTSLSGCDSIRGRSGTLKECLLVELRPRFAEENRDSGPCSTLFAIEIETCVLTGCCGRALGLGTFEDRDGRPLLSITISVFSVGNNANPTSPAFLERLVVSISCGLNFFLLLLVVVVSTGCGNRRTGKGSGIGDGSGACRHSDTASFRPLLLPVSTGTELALVLNERLLSGGSPQVVGPLLPFEKTPQASGAFRRLLFVVVSTGCGKKRRGGSVADMFGAESS